VRCRIIQARRSNAYRTAEPAVLRPLAAERRSQDGWSPISALSRSCSERALSASGSIPRRPNRHPLFDRGGEGDA